jgi:mannose/fructose-specific phosphotransferase system component IIA
MTSSAGGPGARPAGVAAGNGGGRAIVAGHGEFATGLISAVEQITGRTDVFVALSIRSLGGEEIERALRDRLVESGANVVFTDLPAGSCTIAARRVLRDRPDLVLVTGANLPSLLDFVFHSAEPAADAAQHATDKGRSALVMVGGASRGAGGGR